MWTSRYSVSALSKTSSGKQIVRLDAIKVHPVTLRGRSLGRIREAESVDALPPPPPPPPERAEPFVIATLWSVAYGSSKVTVIIKAATVASRMKRIQTVVTVSASLLFFFFLGAINFKRKRQIELSEIIFAMSLLGWSKEAFILKDDRNFVRRLTRGNFLKSFAIS